MPPPPSKWLPEDHLAYFALDLLDLGLIEHSLQAKNARPDD
jgi:hypothetical protein